MTSVPGTELAAVAARFFPETSIELVDGRSWLVCATAGDRRFSVRQLDPALPTSRAELIHEYLARPELKGGTPVVATERQNASAFDARTWANGDVAGLAIPAPNRKTLHLPADVDLSVLEQIATALGSLHQTGTTTSLLARAPKFRIDEMLGQAKRTLALNERALGSEIRKESRARRWLTASRVLLANAETNLEGASYLRDEPLVLAHGDLWGSHIVASGATEPVFLDFSMISAAPAVLDLGQLLARNGPWTDERVERTLTAYAAANPIQPFQRRMLPWLVAVDAVVTCGTLLARAHDDRQPIPDRDRRSVLAAADQQLDLLQGLAASFVPPAPRPRYRPGRRT